MCWRDDKLYPINNQSPSWGYSHTLCFSRNSHDWCKKCEMVASYSKISFRVTNILDITTEPIPLSSSSPPPLNELHFISLAPLLLKSASLNMLFIPQMTWRKITITYFKKLTLGIMELEMELKFGSLGGRKGGGGVNTMMLVWWEYPEYLQCRVNIGSHHFTGT